MSDDTISLMKSMTFRGSEDLFTELEAYRRAIGARSLNEAIAAAVVTAAEVQKHDCQISYPRAEKASS